MQKSEVRTLLILTGLMLLSVKHLRKKPCLHRYIFKAVSKNWDPAGQGSRFWGDCRQRSMKAFFEYFYSSHPLLPPRHTIKTVEAASNMTQLIALSPSLIRHTHFFICAIALAPIVQLSPWSGLTLTASDRDLI